MAALDRLSPVQKAWGGANASAFRAALVEVNGFDEAMRCGGGDKELGVRLTNGGVRGRHLRYTALAGASRPSARLGRPGA